MTYAMTLISLALALMLVHALWATLVLIKKDDAAIGNFHRLSVFVWLVWLVPYVSGFLFSLA